ncbi:MAG: peptidoglycan editing factor PgeF [Candidatus Babeliaceae bacterium]|jgi:hypothetical protein
MIMHRQSGLAIYFGDRRESFVPGQFYGLKDPKELLQKELFEGFAQILGLQDLALLKQTHGTEGIIISKMHEYRPYEHEGDYLITNMPHLGLGIATADCLPIIFHDPIQQIIANAHAGWKGTLAGIAVKVVQAMQKAYNCSPAHIQVFFGPSARVCCYEVGEDFVQNVKLKKYIKNIDNKKYFDVPLYNKLLLIDAGISAGAINSDYNICTMCDLHFCSYRRDNNAQRQVTIVTLQ